MTSPTPATPDDLAANLYESGQIDNPYFMGLNASAAAYYPDPTNESWLSRVGSDIDSYTGAISSWWSQSKINPVHDVKAVGVVGDNIIKDGEAAASQALGKLQTVSTTLLFAAGAMLLVWFAAQLHSLRG